MKLRTLTVLFLAAATPLFPIACGGGNDNLPPPPPAPSPRVMPSASASSSSANVADAAPPPPAAPPVLLVMGTASPDPVAPLPVVKIAAPTSGQVVAADKAGDFQVKLDVKNWQTATGSSHVHLILDNKPYKPIYDTKAAIKLSELTGGEALAEGEHTIVAFASRMNHESVKTKDAIAMLNFYVGKKGDSKVDLKKPMLIYSRPKGEYKGDNASHLLVDFQVANVTLAEGKEHVHITVSGPGIDKPLEAKAEKFGPPYYLDNLQNGQYTVKCELMGGDMKVLAGPWNSTTRTITINRDAPADPMPPMAMGAADAGAPAPVVDAGAKPATPKDAGAKK
jgi:hypothetical protein